MNIDYRKVLKALGEYVSYLDYPWYRFEALDSLRQEVEGYYLRGDVTEERFLSICDSLDNELYDDYKDMYEPGSIIRGIPLEHYIYALESITGKRPEKTRHWTHLKVGAD